MEKVLTARTGTEVDTQGLPALTAPIITATATRLLAVSSAPGTIETTPTTAVEAVAATRATSASTTKTLETIVDPGSTMTTTDQPRVATHLAKGIKAAREDTIATTTGIVDMTTVTGAESAIPTSDSELAAGRRSPTAGEVDGIVAVGTTLVPIAV